MIHCLAADGNLTWHIEKTYDRHIPDAITCANFGEDQFSSVRSVTWMTCLSSRTDDVVISASCDFTCLHCHGVVLAAADVALSLVPIILFTHSHGKPPFLQLNSNYSYSVSFWQCYLAKYEYVFSLLFRPNRIWIEYLVQPAVHTSILSAFLLFILSVIKLRVFKHLPGMGCARC